MQFKAIALVTLLLLVQGWCKPSKNTEEFDYNEDVPADEDDDLQSEDDGESPDTIEEPPQITTIPRSLHVRAGSTVMLPCVTTNAESLAVVWKKGEEFLYSDENALTQDKDRIVRTPENTLVIYNATVNDTSDDYTCSILRDRPVSITYRLLVDPIVKSTPTQTTTTVPSPSPSPSPSSSPAPDRHGTPSERVEAVQGQDIRLICRASAQPLKEMKWFQESNKLYNNQKTSMHGNTLTIHKVNRHDAGFYQCLADNGKENPPHAAIHLVVNYAPEIEVEREIVHTGAGVESEITCIVHAHPRANVNWYKNQKELPKKVKISRKSYRHTLRIMHTSDEDLGDYTCVAKNELGSASKTISLSGTPSEATIYGVEVTKDDSGLILKWRLESYSPITEYKLKYRRKGEEKWQETEPPVTDGKGIQYTVEHAIEGLQPGSYEAILVARNSFGWSPPSAPHTFVRDYSTEEAAGVKTGSAVSIRPFWSLPLSLLVVCAFRYL